VIKTVSTLSAPSNGWAHWVNRPDKGDLLACANDGSIYRIVYSQYGPSQKVANPTTAAALATISGTLAKAAYSVSYTYTTPEGETLPISPAASFPKPSGTGTIGIRVTAGTSLPARATGIAVYIGPSGGPMTKQGTSSTPVFNQTSPS